MGFPGGRVEKSDILNKSIKLSKKNLDDLSKLKSTKTLSIGLISAAIRETEEETNLKLIDKNFKKFMGFGKGNNSCKSEN